jgi:hypothetical protein
LFICDIAVLKFGPGQIAFRKFGPVETAILKRATQKRDLFEHSLSKIATHKCTVIENAVREMRRPKAYVSEL